MSSTGRRSQFLIDAQVCPASVEQLDVREYSLRLFILSRFRPKGKVGRDLDLARRVGQVATPPRLSLYLLVPKSQLLVLGLVLRKRLAVCVRVSGRSGLRASLASLQAAHKTTNEAQQPTFFTGHEPTRLSHAIAAKPIQLAHRQEKRGGKNLVSFGLRGFTLRRSRPLSIGLLGPHPIDARPRVACCALDGQRLTE